MRNAGGGSSSDGSDGSGASNGLVDVEGADQLRESKAVSSMAGAGGVGSDSEENACELDDSPNPFSGAGSDSPAYASSGGQDAEAGSPASSDLLEQGKIGDEGAGVEDGLDGLDAGVGAGQLEDGGPVEESEEAKNDYNGGLAEDEQAALAGDAGERGNGGAKEGARGHEESKTEMRQGVDGALASEQGPEEGASASASPAPEEPAEAQGAGAEDAEAAGAQGAVAEAAAAADVAPAVSAAPVVDSASLEGSPVAPLAVDDVAIAVDDMPIAVDDVAIAADDMAIAVDDVTIAVDDMPVAVDDVAIAVDDVAVAVDDASQAMESSEAKAPEGKGLDIAEGLEGGGSSGTSGAVSAASSSEAKSVKESPAESMESIIDALPPGFVRCPGCPMVSRSYRSRCSLVEYGIASHHIAPQHTASCLSCMFLLFKCIQQERLPCGIAECCPCVFFPVACECRRHSVAVCCAVVFVFKG